ncbi:MAG TPA: LptE family protein [Thermoanaerobaculia bacterium]|nr:LptE family protein [Thermoanaerobaculia bacterium]
MKRALLLLCFTLSGCGYALVGTGNFLPPTIKTIQVPTFVNRTSRVELEQRVTQAVAEEMVSRGRLKLVSSAPEADAILRGTIEGFGINPVSINTEGRATQYQVTVTARIELVDHKNEDKILWQNEHYYFTENYPINSSASDAFDQETRAINEIARRFAETLVANLLEGF